MPISALASRFITSATATTTADCNENVERFGNIDSMLDSLEINKKDFMEYNETWRIYGARIPYVTIRQV